MEKDLDRIKNVIQENIEIKKDIQQHLSNKILELSDKIFEILKQNGTIFLFGNGGSAADAQHVAAEFVGRFAQERKALPAEALTTNTSILTAIGNDYDFSEIFSRQIQARVSSNDLVVGISTSGKSANVLKALQTAKTLGATTVVFTGENDSEIKKLADICFNVPSNNTPRIQEAHILVWHIICDLVENKILNK